MRIALVTESVFPDQLGGIQKYSSELAVYLKQQGHDVLLLHTLPAPKASIVFGSLGIECVHIPVQGKGIFIWKYLHLNREFSEKALKKAEEWGADIAYTQGFTGMAEASLGDSKMKVVHNFHGLEMFQPLQGFKAKIIAVFFRNTVRRILHKARYAVALGNPLAKIMLGENAQLIHDIIPNAVSDHWIKDIENTLEGPRRFLFVGRYEWRKGVHILNEALQKVFANPKAKDMHFTFVGHIPEDKRLHHPQIHYAGPVYDEVVLKQFYASHDVLVNASFSEGMPTVVLEAMAMGMGIIATDCGATSDLVSESNGRLIPPFDAQALEKSILEFCELPAADLHSMGEFSQKMIKNTFNWEQIADKHSSFFKKICR